MDKVTPIILSWEVGFVINLNQPDFVINLDHANRLAPAPPETRHRASLAPV